VTRTRCKNYTQCGIVGNVGFVGNGIKNHSPWYSLFPLIRTVINLTQSRLCPGCVRIVAVRISGNKLYLNFLLPMNEVITSYERS
jgi:hypothetical protein